MKSIQTKLTVTILVIFVIAMGVLGGLNYWKAHEIIYNDIRKSMENTAVSSANYIGDWLEACKLERDNRWTGRRDNSIFGLCQ